MFAGVVFLGALLLFQVQLLLGKHLLPRYGGASAVWTTCLLFFQAALLAGYAWAHLLDSRLSKHRQRGAHLALLGAALALLVARAATWPSPITPLGTGAPPPSGEPISSILSVLASTIGLPFVVLAATSPLLQARQSLLEEAFAPLADHLAASIQAHGNLVIVDTCGGHQDHLGTNDFVVRQRIFRSPTIELSGLIGGQIDTERAFPWHRRTLLKGFDKDAIRGRTYQHDTCVYF